MTAPKILITGAHRLAYHHVPGRLSSRSPGILFLGGFRSDMTGLKGEALDAYCREKGISFTHFDYVGHGASSGEFADGCIGIWLENAQAILDKVAQGPQILVGSSMGGWLSLLLARNNPERIVGLVGIAAAPDFTERFSEKLTPLMQSQLETQGFVAVPPKDDDEGYSITQAFLDEAQQHSLLDNPPSYAFPVHLLHGLEDPDVPWDVAMQLLDKIDADDVRVTLLKKAGHRLSEPKNLRLLLSVLTLMYNDVAS